MSTKAKALQILVEKGIDVQNGIIPINGEVCEEMYDDLLRTINTMANSGIEYEELTVALSTYGGDLYYGFAIHDLLKSQPMPIRMVLNGPVMSAGTVIMLAGKTRTINENSYLMFHYGEAFVDSLKGAKHNDRILKRLKEMYKAGTKASTRTINTWFHSETYYSADDALKLGMVHGIICNGKTRKK